RFFHLRQHAVVDRGVVLGPTSAGRQLPARHHHDPAACCFDVLELLLVGGCDLVETRRCGRQLVGTGTAHYRPAGRPRRRTGPRDQPLSGLVVETHTALGGVHGLGYAEPVRPQVLAIPDGRVPIDRCLTAIGTHGVLDDVRGGESDTR